MKILLIDSTFYFKLQIYAEFCKKHIFSPVFMNLWTKYGVF